MPAVKTATTSAGSAITGTLTLYHAEETFGVAPPVYSIAMAGGYLACGLAAAWWDNDSSQYVYAPLGPGDNIYPLIGEGYDETKRVYVAWIMKTIWQGTSPEDKYMVTSIADSALTRLYVGTDPTPFTVSVNYSLALTGMELWRERTHTPATGRDGSPVYAHETAATDTWVFTEPGTATVTCGGASYSPTQVYDPTLEVYNPLLDKLTSAGIDWYLHGGNSGSTYGAATLNWSGHTVDFTGRKKVLTNWTLTGSAETVTLACTNTHTADLTHQIIHDSPRMVDFSQVFVRNRQGTAVDTVRLSGPFQASPRVPASLSWSTTP